ncbi:hypothetical protein GCM10027038_09780 [Arthrobacter bambusae]
MYVDPVQPAAARFAVADSQTAGGSSFNDVGSDNQFFTEIRWLAKAGVSTGWAQDNTYRPLQPVNRDAMAAFMYRLAGKPEFTPPATSPFADVATDNQFYKEITWLAAQGISTGWVEAGGTKTYRPLQPVNRDAMAAFMYRYAGKPAYSAPGTPQFFDVGVGSQFYAEISWLASAGVSTGYVDHTYRPVQPVNRDAMAAFMYRFIARPQTVSGSNAIELSVGPMGSGHASALVSLSILDAPATATISIAGAPAMVVRAGSSLSTTVLTALSAGQISVSASAPAEVRVKLLATFDGAPSTPGSTIALGSPITRADTAHQLAGEQLSTTPISIGVTGAGGVPATGVRAVYATATVQSSQAGTLHLGGQDIPVPAGASAVTTVLVPADNGTVSASLSGGLGALRLDVRGYVPDAGQGANSVNVAGSFVPTNPVPQSLTVTAAAPAPVTLPGVRDRAFALALIAATPTSSRAALALGPDGANIGSGAVVDVTAGAGAQLALVPMGGGQTRASLSSGTTSATVVPLGDILSDAATGGAAPPSVRITSPANDSTVDLSTTGMLTIEGTLDPQQTSTASMTIASGGTIIGSPLVRQTPSGVRWSFRTGVPASGRITFQVAVTDRAGQQGVSTVAVTATLPAPTTTLTAPDAVLLDPTKPGGTFSAVTPTQVTFPAEPDVKPGEVVVSGVTAAAPQGVLRRVTAINKTASGWVADTAPAAITEAIHQANIDQIVPLNTLTSANISPAVSPGPDDTPNVVVTGGGVPAAAINSGAAVDLAPYPDPGTPQALAAAPMAGVKPFNAPGWVSPSSIGVETNYTQSLELKAKFGFPVGKPKTDYSTANDATATAAKAAIQASGGFSLEAASQIGIGIHFRLMISPHLDWGNFSVKVDDFSVILTTTSKTGVTADAYLSVATTDALKKKIASIALPTMSFPVGPFPVVVSNKADVFFESHFSAQVSVSVTASVQRSQDYGFRYSTDGGLQNASTAPVTTIKTPLFGPHGSGAVTGEIEASMGPTLEVTSKIYDAAGPVFGVGAQIGAKGTVTGDETGYKFEASTFLEGTVKVEVKLTVPIIDKAILAATLISLSRRWTLQSWSSDYAAAFPGTTLPGTSPSPTPSPPTGGPGTGTYTSIAQGLGTGYGTKSDGAAWSWGLNDAGQLGNGTVTDWSQPHPMTPQRIPGLSNVKAVSAGTYTGHALLSDGTVWGWGSNNSGSIGDGTTTPRSSPVQVTGLSGITALSALQDTSYALKSDGTVWGWGDNYSGQLGDTEIFHPAPVQIPGLANVSAIAAGSGFVLALSSGKVWTSGYAYGGNTRVSSGVIPVAGLPEVKAIAAGESGYALGTDGSVWAWGANYEGQLGDGTTVSRNIPNRVSGLDNAVAIAASSFSAGSAYALRSDGTVLAWGSNWYGSLGDGTTVAKLLPVQVQGLNNVTSIIGGQANAFAMAKDGTLWGWGANGNNNAMMVPGALGDGTATNRLTPVQLGAGTTGGGGW